MKFKQILITLVIAFMFTSCIGGKEQRAKNKLKRKWNAIQDILRDYPELSDTIKKNKIDTIYIERYIDSMKFNIKKDSVFIDSILKMYLKTSNEAEYLEKEMSSLKINAREFVKPRKTIQNYKDEKLKLESELKLIRQQLINKTCPDQFMDYEDSLITARITIQKGVLMLFYEIKSKKIAYEKEENNIILDATRSGNFWDDPKIIWLLFAILVLLLIIKIFEKRGN